MGSAGDSAMHQHRHEGGAYRRIELITGVARRRRWTAAEKAALVAESLQPGVNISALARRHGVNRGLLQTWRRNAARQAVDHGGSFIPLRVEDAPAADAGSPGPEQRVAAPACPDPVTQEGAIEIESRALRVRFSGPVDAGALRIVLAHLGRHA